MECEKCEVRLPDEDSLGRHQWEECLFEVCDNAECRALRDPNSREECFQALEHWKEHSVLSGCSHGQ